MLLNVYYCCSSFYSLCFILNLKNPCLIVCAFFFCGSNNSVSFFFFKITDALLRSTPNVKKRV